MDIWSWRLSNSWPFFNSFFDRSITRSLDGSLDGSRDRSIVWSFAPSLGRLSARSLDASIARHAGTVAIVHACTMIIVHACTVIIVYACTMIIVHAWTMIIGHLSCGTWLMFGAIQVGGSGVKTPQESSGFWGPCCGGKEAASNSCRCGISFSIRAHTSIKYLHSLESHLNEPLALEVRAFCCELGWPQFGVHVNASVTIRSIRLACCLCNLCTSTSCCGWNQVSFVVRSTSKLGVTASMRFAGFGRTTHSFEEVVDRTYSSLHKVVNNLTVITIHSHLLCFLFRLDTTSQNSPWMFSDFCVKEWVLMK